MLLRKSLLDDQGAIAGAPSQGIGPGQDAHCLRGKEMHALARQQVLTRADPVEFQVILSEAVLRCPVGTKRVWRGQLERLLEVTEQPNITIQVVPFTAGSHAGMEGAFTILTLPELASDIGYVEGPMGPVYLEDQDHVRRCTMRFAMMSSLALNPSESVDLISSILAEYQ